MSRTSQPPSRSRIPSRPPRSQHASFVVPTALRRRCTTPRAHSFRARTAASDTARLVAYRPEYLAGWRAEEYAIELEQAWERALATIDASQRARCARDVPGDTHRALSVTNRSAEETFKHVLLPVWTASYRYRDAVYRFLVNGQTGEVAGTAPYSAWNIALAVLAVVRLVAAAALVWAPDQAGR
jgi:hypothetical protein